MPVLLTRQCFPLNINRLSESSVFLPGSAWLLAVTPWGVAEQGRLTCETMPAFYLVSLLGLISQCMWKKKQQIFPNSQVGNCIGSTPCHWLSVLAASTVLSTLQNRHCQKPSQGPSAPKAPSGCLKSGCFCSVQV